jgi:hypothetical protein
METQTEEANQSQNQTATTETTKEIKEQKTIEILPRILKAGEWDSSPPVPPQ